MRGGVSIFILSILMLLCSVSVNAPPGGGGGGCDSDGVCESAQGENCDTCNSDCGCGLGSCVYTVALGWHCQSVGFCNNNGVCEAGLGETAQNCADCAVTDSDSDGVPDTYDRCPNTPASEDVDTRIGDTRGCSCSQITCTKDCDYLDTVCSNYNDVPVGCNAGVCGSADDVTCDVKTDNNGAACTISGTPGYCNAGTCVRADTFSLI